MTRYGRTLTFEAAMKIGLLLFLCALSATVFAQQKTVDGIVFDKDSKGRIAKVNVLNATTGKSVYNTFKGEFNIEAKPGDVLIFTKPDHYADTLQLQNNASLAVYMKRSAIQLKEVFVRDTMLNPQKLLEATKRDYTKIYGSLDNHDLLSVYILSSGLVLAMVSVSALPILLLICVSTRSSRLILAISPSGRSY